MVRFSCFQAHNHFYKQKRTVTEAMQKTLEDASRSVAFNKATENKMFSKDDGVTLNRNRDHETHSTLTDCDCRSEEIESKCNSDSDDAFHRNAPIKKCLSLGSGLNRKEETLDLVGSEDQTEQKNSSDGAGVGSGIIQLDGSNNRHGLSMSDQYEEPMPSDSVHVHYDFAKDESIFSLGDPQALEKECFEEDDIRLSGGGDSVEQATYTPPAIVRSSSLPSMASPNRVSRSILSYSRSSEDLNALHSRKKGVIHEVERELPHQKENSSLSKHKNNDKYFVDDPYDTYNCVGSAKEWIIPVPDGMEKSVKGESTVHHWDEVLAKDFRLKRIEEWVCGLEHCNSLEESNDISSSVDHEFPNANDSLEELTAVKPEAKTSPGMEAAKRYISSLNASATAAQLTNLGLVVIPFLSAFASLKALNLSGNSIVRITAGALPRGLHILNLSRSSISTIEGLRDLTRLRVLDLSYNRILRIGHGLAGCSSLKELYLAGNKISEVEGLHRLLKLNVLDLRFNKISTTKCLGQLASNYNCLQALSLEGNPAQKNVGDEQLKKYVQSLLPHLTYYNRQSIKVGKDASDRTARLSIGAHQIDRGLRVEAKSSRKGGIVAQKVLSSSSRKSQVVSSQKMVKSSRHVRLPPSGTSKGHQVTELVSSKVVMSLRNNVSSIRRSSSEGTLGVLQ